MIQPDALPFASFRRRHSEPNDESERTSDPSPKPPRLPPITAAVLPLLAGTVLALPHESREPRVIVSALSLVAVSIVADVLLSRRAKARHACSEACEPKEEQRDESDAKPDSEPPSESGPRPSRRH